MCTIQKSFSGVAMTCQNPGANTHAGLHYAATSVFGRNYTWRWAAPTSSANALNTDDVPSFSKPLVVGQADI